VFAECSPSVSRVFADMLKVLPRHTLVGNLRDRRQPPAPIDQRIPAGEPDLWYLATRSTLPKRSAARSNHEAPVIRTILEKPDEVFAASATIWLANDASREAKCAVGPADAGAKGA